MGSYFNKIYKAIEFNIRLFKFFSFRKIFIILVGSIGILIILLSSSLFEGTNKLISNLFKELDCDLITINFSTTKKEEIGLTPRDIRELSKIEGIKKISPYILKHEEVIYRDKSSLSHILGVKPEYFKMRRLALIKGRFINDIDLSSKNNVCLLGYELYKKLGVESKINHINIGEKEYKIVGILRDKGKFSGMIDYSVFLPLSCILKEETKFKELLVKVSSLEKARFAIISFLYRKGFDRDSFFVVSPRFILEWRKKEVLLWSISGMLVSFILLLITGAGIYSTLSIEVQSKLREIGILRSIGAKRRDIFAQFLTEAIFLSILSWILGTSFAILFSPIIENIFKFKLSISLFFLCIALSVMIILSLLASIYPANKASKIEPAEALRYE